MFTSLHLLQCVNRDTRMEGSALTHSMGSHASRQSIGSHRNCEQPALHASKLQVSGYSACSPEQRIFQAIVDRQRHTV